MCQHSSFNNCGHLGTLPEFDFETYPFIVCSGTNGLNIMNLSNDYIDPFFQSNMLA